MKTLKEKLANHVNLNKRRAYLVLFIVPLFFCCRGPLKEQQKAATSASPLPLHNGEEKRLAVDTKATVVTWKGSNAFGPHTGYVYASEGELMVGNGQLTGGTVEIDMNTIEDSDHGKDNGLINHLKDPDFFDVKIYPKSSIAITRVEPINDGHQKVTGNLTIKGITNEVSFPVQTEVEDEMVQATGKLVIDRTDWGIRYKSGKFFDLLADKTISDSIEFEVKIVAKIKP